MMTQIGLYEIFFEGDIVRLHNIIVDDWVTMIWRHQNEDWDKQKSLLQGFTVTVDKLRYYKYLKTGVYHFDDDRDVENWINEQFRENMEFEKNQALKGE